MWGILFEFSSLRIIVFWNEGFVCKKRLKCVGGFVGKSVVEG